MYPVSQEYINKLLSIGAKRRYIRGTIDGIVFDENDVIMNSLKYSKQAVGSNDIKLGGVFLSTLNITFSKAFSSQITRGTWNKKQITLSIGLEVTPNEVEYVPIGVYEVNEADHTAQGVKVTAYDKMYDFDKSLSITTSSGSVYSFLSYACEKCGVALGMTRQEIEALPNGDETLSTYPDNDMTTYRDLISWLGVTTCTFATTDRNGALILKGWQTEPVFTFGINDRFEGGSFSDFVTRYTGVSFGNIAEQTTTYIHVNPDDGLTMSTGMNPFLQYGLPETKDRQRQAILAAMQNFAYTPFSVKTFADPCFDLGDVIRFTGGLAGTQITSCIMRMDFSFTGGMTLQGFGKNPSLFGAQSKTDKDISGLMSQNKANEIKFIHFTNIEDIIISGETEDEVIIASLDITSDREGWVEVQTTCNYLFVTETQLNATNILGRLLEELVRFYLDGELVSEYFNHKYSHVRATQNDWTMLEHYFALRMGANERKTLTVKMTSPFLYYYRSVAGLTRVDDIGTSIDIFPNSLNIYVKGQCLAETPSWDGYITLADEITMVDIGNVGNKPITDSVDVQIKDVEGIDLAEEVDRMEIKGIGVVNIAESLNIILTQPTFNVVDETGEFNFVTEDGDNNITTE